MPNKLIRFLILFIILMVTGFSIGYLKTFISLRENHAGNNYAENIENHDVSNLEEIKLKPGAKMIYITYYSGCGHENREEKTAEERFAGFTKKQLEKEVEGWEIESFTPDEVVLKKQIDGICGDHYYIGLNDGYVTLFRGLPGVQSEVVEKTDILADTLREEDRTMLERGIIINSREEFLEIREGLTN
ncbi:MAG: BofC C-terminal domain-containing protein [Tepidanaerobacteraceae bacterium]|nr:BofC C-terminal domain-containing protein [Tepidanaerobacteraceae bacterium]